MINIDAFNAERSGVTMTYAAPGQSLTHIRGLPNRPTTWHRFIFWDRGDEVEDDDFCLQLWDWCKANRVHRPSGHPIPGYGAPLFVATASDDKALLLKLTWGGAA